MNYKDPIQAWKLFENNHFKDLETSRLSLLDLIQAHGDIFDELSVSNREFPTWQLYIEALIHKLIFCSRSICDLTKGSILKSRKYNLEANIMDYPSIYILTRAAIENFLTLDYIFYNDLPIEEKLFRFKLWEVSGLLSRQNFHSTNIEEYEKKKASERQTIATILDEISKMPEYSNLNRAHLSKLRKYGLPRLESWNSLILTSKLKKSLFGDAYSLFSNYAHSEFLSILQFRQSSVGARNPHVQDLVSICLTIVRCLNSLSIEWLTENFDECRTYFNNLPKDLQSSIRIFVGIGKE